MVIKPTTSDAYNLFHEGSLALAEVEANGMRVDVGRLDSTVLEITEKIGSLSESLKTDEVWHRWKRRYGEKMQPGSRPQLGTVLTEMGYGLKHKTKGGKRIKVDEEALNQIDLQFVRDWLEIEKLKKLKSTYLIGLKREVVDGFVHPVFNLHLVRTYRSSADSPNIQNQIVRDKEAAQLLRSCFIPRPGHVLTECDYGALEYRGAAMFWRDDGMMNYASDPSRDIHRDTASLCFAMSKDQVSKDSRYCGKNGFVFPRLYGSDYIAISRYIWDLVDSLKLKLKDESASVKEHLESRGIDRLGSLDRRQPPEEGTFEHQIKKVQDKWDRWFPQWVDRKEKWVRQYRERGWFDLMTGFRCSGTYSINELYNYPIQGPCFHLLLWSLIRLQKEMKRRRMKSVIVAQIHDSIIADVHKSEVDDYFALAKQVMTEDVRKQWSWVCVPLVMEPEICIGSWAAKQPWEEGMKI